MSLIPVLLKQRQAELCVKDSLVYRETFRLGRDTCKTLSKISKTKSIKITANTKYTYTQAHTGNVSTAIVHSDPLAA